MRQRKVARRYAQALFELVEKNHLQVGERLRLFAALVEESRELKHVLLSPAFRAEERRQSLKRVLQHLHWGPPLDRFLSVLVENRRLDVLADVADIFMEMADQQAGRIRARVASATALDEKEQAALRQAIQKATGREVVLENRIVPELLAGLQVKLGDLTLDGSLRRKLEDLREKLLHTRA